MVTNLAGIPRLSDRFEEKQHVGRGRDVLGLHDKCMVVLVMRRRANKWCVTRS